ncbi:hypothetical protein R6Q57_025067 [Mikania cordata]
MEIKNSEMPCKIRKRRFPTVSSSSFANNSLSQFLMDRTDSPPHSGKCVDKSDQMAGEEEGPVMVALRKSGIDDRVNEVVEKSIASAERSRNKSRGSPGRVCVPEVINPHYRQSSSFMEKDNSFVGMPLTYVAKPFEGKSQPCDKIETVTNVNGHPMVKPTHGLEEIKHSLTVSKELLKLLTHVWTTDSNHDHNYRTSISIASTLHHELKKARYHVNKLIQEQGSNHTSNQEPKEQDKIRVAVKTILHELETERKLRRQSERMNKKLGRELANTKSNLTKAMKKAESEKQATLLLEQLCEKMAHSIEEDRVELEELKKESERVRFEMEEEREMLRVADVLREERVQMKLIDAKYEYEDKHKQMNVLVRELEEVLAANNGSIDHIAPIILSWYQTTSYNNEESTNNSIWYENEKSRMMNEKNTLDEESRDLSWFENKVEVADDQTTNTQNEATRRNSDCIEWEFGVDMKTESENLIEWSEEKALGMGSTKEYEDELERYKMIKDLRDRIVSGGFNLSHNTIELGSYM